MKITIDINDEDYKMFCNEPNMFTTSLHKAIRNGEPVITSGWMEYDYLHYTCQNCKYVMQSKEYCYTSMNYCPKCGAKMVYTIDNFVIEKCGYPKEEHNDK